MKFEAHNNKKTTGEARGGKREREDGSPRPVAVAVAEPPEMGLFGCSWPVEGIRLSGLFLPSLVPSGHSVLTAHCDGTKIPSYTRSARARKRHTHTHFFRCQGINNRVCER